MARSTSKPAGTTNRERSNAETERLLAQLETTLTEAGMSLATTVRDETLSLAGIVGSAEQHQAALDIATAVVSEHGLRIDDGIEVAEVSPDNVFGEEDPPGSHEYADPDSNPYAAFDPSFEVDPDFTDDLGTTDSEEAAAEATPYFPPTDPVVRPTTGDEQLEVVGGFSATAMDDPSDGGTVPLNDDDLAQIVRRELRADALTIDLDVRVAARDGTIILRGQVITLEDAENAEAVAARVEGVRDVREELTIPGLRGDR